MASPPPPPSPGRAQREPPLVPPASRSRACFGTGCGGGGLASVHFALPRQRSSLRMISLTLPASRPSALPEASRNDLVHASAGLLPDDREPLGRHFEGCHLQPVASRFHPLLRGLARVDTHQ